MRVEARPIQQELLDRQSLGTRRAQHSPSTRAVEEIPGEQTENPHEISEEVVKAAAEAANKIANVFNTTIEFSVHEETGFEMIKIVDSRTNCVIREMPPHEILDMIARMWEAIGVFVDRTA